jgi:large subunit ribosomal protein L25
LIAVHRGESFVLKLRVKDNGKYQERSVLIKQIQHHPVRDDIIHVDFNEISLTKTIKVKVPLVAVGEAVGVKLDGGVLDHILWELEIECLPAQIPESIEVNVSGLKIGDSLHVKDLTVPEGVKFLNDPEAAVLAVDMPRKEEAAPAAAEAGAGAKAEPEVIKEKKEKPEAADAQAGKAASGGKKPQEEKK